MYEKLLNIVERISTASDQASIRNELLTSVVELEGIESARLYKRVKDGYRVVENRGGKDLKGFTIPEDYVPVRIALEKGYFFGSEESEGVDPEIEKALGVNRFAAVSIKGDYLIGYGIKNDADEDRIGHILKTVASVTNSMLEYREALIEKSEMEKELNLAYEIQSSILPSEIPSIEGYDIYGFSRPVKRNVGGDYYDFFNIDEENMAFVISDASGKGFPAALFIRDIHTALIMSLKYESKIDKLVSHLNNLLYERFERSKHTGFVSLFYGELNVNGSIFYVNAGHNYPVLMENKKVLQLDKGGTILGVFPDQKYSRGVVTMNPGSVLLLYTDGITEAVNREGEFFGTERLIDVLSSSYEMPSKAIAREIENAVKDYRSGYRINDDMTVVVIKRKK